MTDRQQAELLRARAQFFRRQGVAPPRARHPHEPPAPPPPPLPVAPHPPPAWVPPAPPPGVPPAAAQPPALAAVPKRVDVPVGHTAWLPLASLVPWRLQRRLSRPAVRRIAREYRRGQMWPLVVSRRNGVCYLLDGQHRYRALVDILGWGDREMQCTVYDNLTDEEEDDLYYAQAPGQRRPTSALEGFEVLVDRRDPLALQVVATVERAGLAVSYTNTTTDNTVVAAKALLEIGKTAGIDRLGKVLAFCKEAMGPQQAAYSGEMLKGYALFLARFERDPDFDRPHLVRRVSKIGHTGVWRRAHDIRAGQSCSMVQAIGRAFLVEHDRYKSTHRLGEWRENVRNPPPPPLAAPDDAPREGAAD